MWGKLRYKICPYQMNFKNKSHICDCKVNKLDSLAWNDKKNDIVKKKGGTKLLHILSPDDNHIKWIFLDHSSCKQWYWITYEPHKNAGQS